MGKILSKIFGNKEMRILMLGLDAAGKTSKLFLQDTLPVISNPKLSSPFHSHFVQAEARPICNNHSHCGL